MLSVANTRKEVRLQITPDRSDAGRLVCVVGPSIAKLPWPIHVEAHRIIRMPDVAERGR